jgi:DtxR family Mn-dependent transcriptional regulator
MKREDEFTDREYDCLLAVESASKAGWPSRLVDVASEMGVNPPTALEVAERLHAKGMIEKSRGGMRLTVRGAAAIASIHRKHRLLELMLKKTGLGMKEACRDSGALSRKLSGESARAICNFLGHPRFCFHRMPIEADPECCGKR